MKKQFTLAAVTLSGLTLATFHAAQTTPAEAQQNGGDGAKKRQQNRNRQNQNRPNRRNGQNAQNNARITDPDAANAPIADRETFNVRSKVELRAPDLAEIAVPRTNYPIPAGALFVSPTGDAGAPGTNRERPTTLANALAKAPARGTIVLRGGDYRDVDNFKIERPVTLQNAPGETVWIKGSDIVSGFAPDGARWFVAWDKKLTHPRENDIDKANPIARETDMVFVNGKSVRQVAALNELKSGTFFVDAAAKRLYLGDDPTGKVVEATARETGLFARGKALAGSSLRGLGFAHYAGNGVDWISSDVTFENNVFAWNAARGLTLHGDNHLVRGNTFACNGLVGFNGVYMKNLLFENNRVLFNNIEGFRKTWAAAGTKMIVTKDSTIRNNLYEGNNAAAMWLDISVVRNNVIGNTIRHNQGLGIFFELAHEGVIAFNLLQDNNVGIMLSDASAARVWNNTLVDNAKGIIVKDTPRFNQAKSEGFYKGAEDLAAGVTWITAQNEIKNNLFALPRNEKTVFLDAGNSLQNKNSATMFRAVDRNVYARSGDAPRALVRWNPGGKPADYESLESFRAANAGFESAATVSANALFVGANGADYRLAPDSPLLNAGEPLPADIAAAARAAGIALPATGVPIGAFAGGAQ